MIFITILAQILNRAVLFSRPPRSELMGVGLVCIVISFVALPPLSLADTVNADAPSAETDAQSKDNPNQDSPDDAAPQDWNLHVQNTEVWQGYPAFSGANGPQSLNSNGQNKETSSATLFAGARAPWSDSKNATEFYLDPEINQGFGLSHVLGVAGFPNGEAQKAGEPDPQLDWARFYVRQTFGFGGAQENIDSGPNQLAGARDISRLTLIAGKMSIPDFFDNNSYSHDPRTQFMNWALIDGGAYDYVADQKGYTGGFVAELNQKDWAIRYGYFFAPKDPNSRFLDESFTGKGGHNLELEERYDIAGQPGVLRILGFANIARAGSYRETLDNPALDLDIAATRIDRTKYGFVLNAEQAITDDLGLFSRFSWNDGQEEISSYTDIDQSFSAGASLKGARWDRPDDTIALAGAVAMLSQAQIDFLKAGGTGILIGDGSLNYAPEGIVETYYNYAVIDHVTASFDYQFIANPAYNQNRGPVHVFGIRTHIEF